MSIRESTAQLRVDGNLESSMGENFSVKYSGSEDLWLIADQSGKKLKEFKGSTELNGLRFNVEGQPALGDRFTVKISNNASENLQIKIKDGNDIAASSFYFIEPAGSNAGNGEISLERFAEIKNDNLKNLNSSLIYPRDAANAISFVSDGVLGYMENVNNIENLASLKSQAKIQFSATLSGLDANSKLKITLGSTEHIFSVGTMISGVTSYIEIADFLNKGGLKSDTNSFSFSDLGLYAGGNKNNLTVSSAAQPPYSSFAKLNSGNLNNVSGVVIPADPGLADLQIFTREGIQLSGKPLTEQQADELISKTNGFAEDAVYTAKYTSIGTENQYIGAEITRLTTAGAQTKTITAIGFPDNLNLYAANSFPSSRPGMSSACLIYTSDAADE